MRLRIHHLLFAGLVLLVAAMVGGVLLLVGPGLREALTRTSRTELARELALGALYLREIPFQNPDSVAGAMTERIGHRVTLIAEDGEVLGDSDVRRDRLPEVENHGDRPEVRAALRGDLAFQERVSATVERPLLYVARPVEWGGRRVVLRLAVSLEEVEASARRARLAVAGAGLLVLLLALPVAWWLSRALARPISELTARTRKMAEGEFSASVPRASGIVEIDELASSFNRLTGELDVHLSELARERDEMQALVDSMAEGVIGLTEDARVFRVNRAAAQILDLPRPLPFAPVGTLIRHPELRNLLEEAVVRPFRAREVALDGRHIIFSARLLDRGGAVVTFLDVTEIRRLEQVRQDFVANASHELKTPLTSVRGFAETLLDDDPPEDLRKDFLASIRDNTVRMQALVDDLLDLSRLESGGWVARREVVDVEPVARRAWGGLGERTRERDVAFRVEGDALVVADEQGLEQILRNLLDNALRFTDAGGEIRVGVADRGERVEIAVSDTGAGIPSTALPRIFERFYRVDAHRARDHGGTGLGLAIVRHLVQAMGGEVEARSRLGEGTTITFTLPGAPGE